MRQQASDRVYENSNPLLQASKKGATAKSAANQKKNSKNREKCSKSAKIQKIAKSAANQQKLKLQDLKNGGFREKYYTSAKIQGTVT